MLFRSQGAVPHSAGGRNGIEEGARDFVDEACILPESHELDILFVAIGFKDDGVGDDEWCRGIIGVNGYLGEDKHTVVGSYLDIGYCAGRFAINVQPEVGCIAAGQSDGRNIYFLAVVVIHH